LNALRSEQQQIGMSITSIQGSVSKLASTLGEHETERQRIIGASKLAKAISGAGWGIVGMIAAGIMIAVGWLAKHLPTLFNSPPPPGGHP